VSQIGARARDQERDGPNQGNPREGVRLLAGAQPLALPPGRVDTEVIAECTALVKSKASELHTIPRPTTADIIPLAPYKGCPKCSGSGWLILDEMRCECTFRQHVKPIEVPASQQLEAGFTVSWLSLQVHIEMGLPAGKSKADRELEEAMITAPRKSKQEVAAEVAELEAALDYRDPKRGGGKHRETVIGAEPYLVQ
jgi:hypothetical protein